MASALKTIVSKNKRRHVEGGFNLDLSYIDERIIAMGFPAEKMESFYRNSLDEVKRFLDQKHEDKYFIYNLCSERSYDRKKFNNRVATYPFDDHHPPDFSIIGPFCTAVQEWLDKNPENVAVVHCKAGKGRTGVMICCYLLHSKKFKSAQDVLKFYGQQRTVDQKGVTIPSQRRYINYYANLIRHNLQYKPVKLYLLSITLDPVPNFLNFNEFCLQFDVRQSSKAKYESKEYSVKRNLEKKAVLVLKEPLLICGDVKLEFSSKPKLDILKTKSKEFHFWFNTFFADKSFNLESEDLCHKVTELSGENDTHSSQGENHSSNGSHFMHHHQEESVRASHANRFLKPSPHAPERHSSCVGGGSNNGDTESGEMSLTELMKFSSISDDHLILDRAPSQLGVQQHQQQQPNEQLNKMITSSSSSSSSGTSFGVGGTAPLSFSNISIEKERRMRHSSVPQTYKSPGAMPHVSHTVYKSNSNQLIPPPVLNLQNVPGINLKIQFERLQIDKVAKDKTHKYADNFNVSLCLFRPDDQSDAGHFSSSPVCSAKPSSGSKSSPDSSSDDETTDSEAIGCSSDNPGSRNFNHNQARTTTTTTNTNNRSDEPQFTRRNVFQSDWI